MMGHLKLLATMSPAESTQFRVDGPAAVSATSASQRAHDCQRSVSTLFFNAVKY